jgi:hypothetical protein
MEKVRQEALHKIKQAIMDDVMLSFLDFNKPFEIHTDGSDVQQLGSVITQDCKPVAFYSRKFNPAQQKYIPAQQKYITGKREILSIIETLRAGGWLLAVGWVLLVRGGRVGMVGS